MRRKSLGKGLRALIPTKDDVDETKTTDDMKGSEPDHDTSDAIPVDEIEETEQVEKPEEITQTEPVSDETSGIEDSATGGDEPQKDITSPDSQLDTEAIGKLIPEEVVSQLKEIREMDFEERRIATYQKALERAWFDEKITADEQFILDGLRDVLDISDYEHKQVETVILHELEKRYSEGIDKKIPLGKIENEHDRRKREIFEFFQRGSELYESDKYFEAIVEWEKILDLDPGNPLIMKAINNARRQIDSPAIEDIGKEAVFSYSNPMKDKSPPEVSAEPEETGDQPEVHVSDKRAWLSEQDDIKSQLVAIKDEEEKERKRIIKLFKLGYKNFKAGKYVKAMKYWKKVLSLDPEHSKARKGMRLALKKYKLRKKQQLKKKKMKKELVAKPAKPSAPKVTEMEIPEVAEIGGVVETAEVVETGPHEMEIPELEEQAEMLPQEAEIIVEPEIQPEDVVEPEVIPQEEIPTEEPEVIPPEEISAEEPEVAHIVEPEEEEAVSIEEPEVIADEDISIPYPPEQDEEISSAIPIETEPEVISESDEEPVIEIPLEEIAVAEPLIVEEAAAVETPEEPEPPEEIPISEPKEIPPEITDEELEKDYYDKAMNLVQRGGFREALEMLDEVLNINPKNNMAWNDKGILLWSLGVYDNALECYNQALDLKQDYTDAWLNKGMVLHKLNRKDDALQAFNEALNLDSNLEEVWTNKGKVLYDLSKWTEAVDCFNKAIELNPRSEDAWLNVGNTYRKMEQFSNASKAFEKVLALNPNNENAHSGIAECQKNLKYELLKAWNI